MIESTDNLRIEKHRIPSNGLADAVAWLFENSEEPTEKPSTVFVVHGLGSRKERHLDLCLHLVRRGFRACTLDAAHHGERETWGSEIGNALSDKSRPEFLPAFAEVVRATVGDIRALADSMGLESYGIVGHSMGGFIATWTAIADSRVRAIVNIAGSLPPPNIPMATATDDAPHDLALVAPLLVPRPILLLHGVDDAVVSVDDAYRFYDALKIAYAAVGLPDAAKLIAYPSTGHALTAEMTDAAADWMAMHL